MAFNKQKSLLKAQKLMQSGKVDAAINEYLMIVKHETKDPAMYQKLGSLYAKKNAIEEAVRCYRQAVQIFQKTGFLNKAIAIGKMALQIDPENTSLLILQGDMCREKGIKEEALDLYRVAVGQYFDRDEYDEAITVLENMLELDPDDPVVKGKYGEALFRGNRKEEAVAVFKELSEVLAMDGKYDELARFHELTLSLNPGDHEIRKDLARTYVRLSRATQARKHLKILFDNNQADAEVFDLVGRVYVLMGKNQKAVAAFLEKIKHLSDDTEIEKTYQRILEIDPTNEQALRFLGEEDDDITEFGMDAEEPTVAVVTVESDAETSYANYDDAETVAGYSGGDAGNFAAAINEASVYMKYGIVDRAIGQLQEIIEKDPNNIQALERLGAAFDETGDQDSLVAVLVQLAEIYEGIGEMSQANSMIQRAESIRNDHPRLKEFRGEPVDQETATPTSEHTPVAETPAETDDFEIEGDVLIGGDEEEEDVFPDAEAFIAEQERAEDEEIPIEDEDEIEFNLADEPEDDEVDADFGTIEDFDLEEEESEEPEEELFELDESNDEEDSNIEVEPDESVFEEEKPYEEELEHARFFLEQGLLEEAAQIIDKLTDEYGSEPAVHEIIRELAAKRPAPVEEEAKAEETSGFSLEGDGFDLAGELESELGFLEDEQIAPGEEDVPTMEEIFDAFKKGVKEQLSDADGAAHYDLGIAYLEMGLTVDAVAEFEVASQSEDEKVDSLNMIGVAKTQLGDFEGAKDVYVAALDLDVLSADARLNLLFELAVVLEELKDYRGAIRYYKEVLAIDREYRSVLDKVKKLKEKLSKK